MASTNTLNAMLRQAKKNYGETVAAAKASDFPEFEDGRYVTRFAGFDIKQSNTPAKSWGVLFQWQITEGERQGDSKYQWVNLFDKDDETQLNRYLIPTLEKLSGTDAEELDITQLETILQDALDENQYWSMQLKTNGQFQNLRLLNRLEDYEAETKAPAKKSNASAKKAEPAAPAAKAKPGRPAKVVEPEPEEDEEEEGEDEEETTTDFEVGDEVTWTKVTGKGRNKTEEEMTGTVHTIDTDAGTVEVKIGGTARKPILETVDIDDLSPVADEEEEAEEDDENTYTYEEGDEVSFNANGKVLVGTITGVDNEGDSLTIDVKVGRKVKTYEVDFSDVLHEEEEAEESEDDEDDEEGEDLQVGHVVEFTDPVTKKEVQGVVTAIDDDASIATVKVGKVNKKVSYDDLQILKEEED